MAYEFGHEEPLDPATEDGQQQLALEASAREAGSRALALMNAHVAQHVDPEAPLIDKLDSALAYAQSDQFLTDLITEDPAE